MKSPLVQYWHAEEIPDDIEELFTLASKHNPDMQHLIFNERTAAALIETHFSAREVAAFEACAVPAMQADYFRYCAVYALGGVYCDADSACTGSLMSLLDADGILFRNIRHPESITNHLFGFKAPSHPLLELTIDIATAGIENRFSEDIPKVTGPWLFTLLARILQLGSVDVYLDQVRKYLNMHPDAPVDHGRWYNHLNSVQAVIGSYARVANAFSGVHVSPYKEVSEFVTRGSSHLSYKKTDDHFPNWKGSIFR